MKSLFQIMVPGIHVKIMEITRSFPQNKFLKKINYRRRRICIRVSEFANTFDLFTVDK